MTATRNGRRPKSPRTQHVTFRLNDPAAAWVAVVGSFADWAKGPFELTKDAEGNWTATIPLMPGRYEYRFLVDGAWRNDPSCHDHVANPFGSENCVVTVPAREAQPHPYCRAEAATAPICAGAMLSAG